MKQFAQGENACCQSLASLQDSCVCESAASVVERPDSHIFYLTSRPVLLSTGQICYLPAVNLVRDRRIPRLNLVKLTIDITPLDRLFVKTAAQYQGISQSELIRRLFAQARMSWYQANLWDEPEMVKSLRQTSKKSAS